jgi:hypothetical protein
VVWNKEQQKQEGWERDKEQNKRDGNGSCVVSVETTAQSATKQKHT